MRIRNRRWLAALSAAVFVGGASNVVIAQERSIEEVVVLGSRVAGRTATDLPVPVDTLTAESLANTGQTEVGRMLQSLAPSFNFSSSSISDGTDALRPATLRGLGPDQTLVLINGKRRHQASLIHINNSVGRGTAGTDMNAIPAAAIQRIEVLRDGAAAQYGSDAIAGVINIVLKEDSEAGSISGSVGEYSDGDGYTENINLNKGFALGDSGFINVTANYRDRGRTSRANPQGVCLYGGCVDTDGNGFLEPALGNEVREVSGPGRDPFRIGDAASEQFAIAINTALELGAGELYGFVTYSGREGASGAFYRNPSSGGAALDDGENVIPDGFLPIINSEIDDFSINIGYREEFDNGATLDISYTNGGNDIDYSTSNTVNYSFVNELNFGRGLSDADIRAQIPRSAFAYGLELNLETINLDYTQSFGDLYVAFGAELRTDEYIITPGEPYSFTDFDSVDGVALYAQNGSGGTQGFGGIGPASAADEERDVISFYLDSEYQLTDDLLVSAAVRYDDYDGFGDTTNFKLAGNLRVTDTVRLRAAASTGFRAPSMQQLFFSNISTQFIGGVQIETGTFRNDSEVAQAIGIPTLKEEESDNFSIGAIIDLADNWNLTIDLYSIDIDDRIVLSNNLGSGLSPALDAALLATGSGGGQFFLNAIDTETDGVDIVSTYSDIEVGGGLLDLTFAANFTDTDIADIFSDSSPALTAIAPEDIFGGFQPSVIETWQPEERISLIGRYVLDDWSFNLALQHYGEYTTVDTGSQTYGSELLTDLRIAYDFGNGVTANISGVNIFDVTPDEVTNSGSRGGNFESAPGLEDLASPTVFRYSRRSAPFGFNGAYWSAGVNYSF
jgi:iron complex outermembrane receptor protein